MQEELLKFEEEFSRAVAANDAAAIGRFVADDWVIVDADGNLIERSRFISVIESGALTHEAMESTDVEVRVYEDTATERALAMCLLTAHSSRVALTPWSASLSCDSA